MHRVTDYGAAPDTEVGEGGDVAAGDGEGEQEERLPLGDCHPEEEAGWPGEEPVKLSEWS